jgi:tRNA nucleotidyltransferase/poly(A) polymerase
MKIIANSQFTGEAYTLLATQHQLFQIMKISHRRCHAEILSILKEKFINSWLNR